MPCEALAHLPPPDPHTTDNPNGAETLTLATPLAPLPRLQPAQREAAVLNLYSFIVPRDSPPCIIRL